LSMIMFFWFGSFSTLFSTDSEVLDVARSGIWVRNHSFAESNLYYHYVGFICYSLLADLD